MSYQNSFFEKYIPEGQEIQGIIHQHVFVVINKVILWFSFGVFIPSFLYYHSIKLQEVIPFWGLEVFLILVFIKIFYDIFNWYNDAWIITNEAIYDLEWSLLKTKLESVKYDSIEGIEVEKDRIWDTIFNKGDIVIHKFGEETIVLENAFSPYKSVEMIDPFLFPEPEEKQDRFELIMNTLGGVVEEYLDKKGLRETYSHSEKKKKVDPDMDEYTIDVRD